MPRRSHDNTKDVAGQQFLDNGDTSPGRDEFHLPFGQLGNSNGHEAAKELSVELFCAGSICGNSLSKFKNEICTEPVINSSVSQFTVFFWNCHGFKNFNLESSSLVEESFDIICIQETWLECDNLKLNFENYNYFHVPGTRQRSKGRSSGGLLMMWKSNVSCFRVLKSCKNWVLVYFKAHFGDLIIVNVYFPPNLLCSYINLLAEDIAEISLTFPDSYLLVGGDWNARIADHQVVEELIFEDTSLFAQRESLDKASNREGKTLLSWAEANGLYVVNGRCRSDTPGQFTYVSKVGTSTVDLIFVNLKLATRVNDFEVHDGITSSDHFPCILRCFQEYSQPPISISRRFSSSPMKRFRWAASKSKVFKECILGLHEDVPSAGFSDFLRKSIWAAAAECGGMLVGSSSNPSSCRAPKFAWFDQECRSAKYFMCKAFRFAKRNSYDPDLIEAYLVRKKRYTSLVKQKKLEFNTLLENKLANVKNSVEFWSAVKFARQKNTSRVDIEMPEVESHFRGLYSRPTTPIQIHLQDRTCTVLDRPVSVVELKSALEKCKNKKAAGPDMLPYEVYKNLPEIWFESIAAWFSYIIENAAVPNNWSETISFLLFKKGDRRSLDNYRGISLINTISKIFFSILNSRLSFFSELNNLLPENQCGFRTGRSCVDHIFTLSSIIDITLRLKNRKLYAAFIDFKKAFDSVNHQILFSKLFSLGISTKFIKVVVEFFAHASVKVKTHTGVTNAMKVTRGVLQGDVLSPLLFSLFISDFEVFCRKRHLAGINVDNQVDVLALFYADDLVILGDSPVDLQKKLDSLSDYCNENDLQVNSDKSKVVVFRRKGKLKRSVKFHFKNSPVEIVSSYKYLGILFSSSGLFRPHMQQVLRNSHAVAEGCYEVVSRFKKVSPESLGRLFESTMLATCLYAGEIWALKYAKNLDTVQSLFYKRILHLPSSTPSHYLRAQFNIVGVKYSIFKLSFNWWRKLLGMPGNRLPKICFKRLLQLGSVDQCWASSFNTYMSDLDLGPLWESQNLDLANERASSILHKLKESLAAKDHILISSSSYNSFFKEVYWSSSFLTYQCSLPVKRILISIRMHCEKKFNLRFKGRAVSFSDVELCSLCSDQRNTFLHFMSDCPATTGARLKNYSTDVLSREKAFFIVSYPSLSDVNVFLSFLNDSLAASS